MSNNKTFEALQEIKIQEIDSINSYLAFCKYYYYPKNIGNLKDFFETEEIKGKKKPKLKLKDNNKQLLKDTFPYLWHYFNDESDIANFIKKYKSNDTTKDFPLVFLKEKILKDKENNKEFSFDISKI